MRFLQTQLRFGASISITLNDMKALRNTSTQLFDILTLHTASDLHEFFNLITKVNLELIHFSDIDNEIYDDMVNLNGLMNSIDYTTRLPCFEIIRNIMPVNDRVTVIRDGIKISRQLFWRNLEDLMIFLKDHSKEMMAIINSSSLKRFFEHIKSMIAPHLMITIYKDYSVVLTEHADALTGILQLLKTNRDGIMIMLQVVNNIPLDSRSTFLTDTSELIKTLNTYQLQSTNTGFTVFFNSAEAGNRQDMAVVNELLKYLGGIASDFTKEQIESLVDKRLQGIILQYIQKYLHLLPGIHQPGIYLG